MCQTGTCSLSELMPVHKGGLVSCLRHRSFSRSITPTGRIICEFGMEGRRRNSYLLVTRQTILELLLVVVAHAKQGKLLDRGSVLVELTVNEMSSFCGEEIFLSWKSVLSLGGW